MENARRWASVTWLVEPHCPSPLFFNKASAEALLPQQARNWTQEQAAAGGKFQAWEFKNCYESFYYVADTSWALELDCPIRIHLPHMTIEFLLIWPALSCSQKWILIFKDLAWKRKKKMPHWKFSDWLCSNDSLYVLSKIKYIIKTYFV